MSEPILVTSALPYANGPIHLGHLVEYIQTDVWVRYLKLAGKDAIYVCASDTHGAPIELNATKAGKTPEAFVNEWHDSQKRDFSEFLIEFDTFYTTHSPENRKWAGTIFERLKAGGHIVEKPLEQWYCETDKRFLPDRFVKGKCPNCNSPDQYGDVCEVCGKAYSSSDLLEPYCAICKTTPVRRTSNHFFFQISAFKDLLDEFTRKEGTLHPTIRNSVRAWLHEGLEDWCVSRDGPYFGFEIPGAAGKYFYVWLDAPIGYLSSTEHLLGEEKALAKYWSKDARARIVHFIGKDIIYFHSLFWPAMLAGAGLHLPNRVQVHGMLTLGGDKLSKSRGHMVTAREWIDAGLDPEALRWYYASNLSAAPNDVPLSLEEIKNRVNAELVRTLANFVARTLTPLKKDLGGKLSRLPDDEPSRALWARAGEASKKIAAAYEAIELRDAAQEIVRLGFEANKYLQDRAPWTKRKNGDDAGALADLTLCANVAYVLGVWIKPIVPKIAAKLEAMLGGVPLSPARLEGGAVPLPEGTVLGEVGHLASPVDEEKLNKLLPAEQPAPAPAPVPVPAPAAAPKAATDGIISYDDFTKVELRVGKILTAEKLQGADKLLVLSVNVGETAARTIVAGIAQHYEPGSLPGKQVVVVTNLAPRKLKGVMSHGMLLAAGDDGQKLVLAEAPGAVIGSRVK